MNYAQFAKHALNWNKDINQASPSSLSRYYDDDDDDDDDDDGDGSFCE